MLDFQVILDIVKGLVDSRTLKLIILFIAVFGIAVGVDLVQRMQEIQKSEATTGVPYGPFSFGKSGTDYTNPALNSFSGAHVYLQTNPDPTSVFESALSKGVKVLPYFGDQNPCTYWNSSTMTFDYNLFMSHARPQITVAAKYYPDTLVGALFLNEPHWINQVQPGVCDSGVPPKYLYELAKRIRQEFAVNGVTDPNLLVGTNSHPSYINNPFVISNYIDPPGGGTLTAQQKADGTINLLYIYVHTMADAASAGVQDEKSLAANELGGTKIVYNANARDKAGTGLPDVGIWQCQQSDAAFVTWWTWAKGFCPNCIGDACCSQVSLADLQRVKQACGGNVVTTNSPTSNPSLTPSPTIPPATSSPIPTGPSPTPIPGNQIENSSFDYDLFGWRLGKVSPGDGLLTRDTLTKAEGEASVKVDVINPATWYGSLQFVYDGVSVVQGETYTLTFWARASSDRSIQILLRDSTSPWTEYASTIQSITSSWKEYQINLTPSLSDSTATLGFHLGQYDSDVWIDSVTFTSSTGSPTPTPTPPYYQVQVNAVEDAYVDEGQPSANFGDEQILVVDGDPDYKMTLLKFDLSDIPVEAIISALFRIRVSTNDFADSSTKQTIKTAGSNDWSELTVTYDQKPSLVEAIGSITTGLGSKGVWQGVDLTSFFRGKEGTVQSIGIDAVSTSWDGVEFNSSESASSPHLLLTLDSAKNNTPTPTNTFTPTLTNTPTPTATSTPSLTSTNTPTPTEPVGCTPGLLPGDGNGDCKVDGVDYGIWFIHYGQVVTGGSAEGNYNEGSDGVVDGIDYGVWFINYGKIVSPP